MGETTWIKNIARFLRLTHEQESPEIIHEAIEKGVVFRGTNLWILVFAILVASVGLNMNSTAVIIGAMLISPLMGPINGVGYSVATYNFELLKKSLKNLGFATAAGLITSTVYFLLTPVHGEHSELLARTSPTIYDVLIATFGGLAGIVAISSTNKGNVITGVAIATALMPPLCTAGYGLSIGNMAYFFGALYLFLINSVFIALSAMIVSQLLKFPKKSNLLTREIKNKNMAVIAVVVLTVVPSVYLGYTLVQKEHFQQNSELFVSKVGVWEGNYLLQSKIDPDKETIVLTYAGNEIDSISKHRLHEKAKDLKLGNAKITIRQGINLSDSRLLDQTNSKENEILRLQSALSTAQSKMDSISNVQTKGKALLKELKTLYPVVRSCSYASTYEYVDSLASPIKTNIVYFELNGELSKEDRTKIENWLKQRLGNNHLILKF